MNKQKRDKKRSDDKKDSFYLSVKNNRFKTGGLKKSELKKLPADRKREYLETQLRIIRGRLVSYTCEECALRVVYHEKGEVTDEELVDLE